MGLIREPKNVDFTGQSKPWTETELRDFRKIMKEIKSTIEQHPSKKQKSAKK